jgi:hypothetical protein
VHPLDKDKKVDSIKMHGATVKKTEITVDFRSFISADKQI